MVCDNFVSGANASDSAASLPFNENYVGDACFWRDLVQKFQIPQILHYHGITSDQALLAIVSALRDITDQNIDFGTIPLQKSSA